VLACARGSLPGGLYNAHLAVARIRDIAEAIERIAPTALSEGWDNCGLQVGRAEVEARRVLVALTPVSEVFEEAE
jgi:putative NIF3 family GTP cyclohydrolase 1 type 2